VIGDWSEEDVKNGLRTPTGQMVGGLDIIDYVRGREDFASGAAPPAVTSASYDLGRRRASEAADAKADFLAQLARERAVTHQRVRELLSDRPDLLAEYEARIAAIDAKTAHGATKAIGTHDDFLA
jgi:hypothetical protein